MEQKQIIPIVLSCLAVFAVIFCGRALNPDYTTDTNSQAETTPAIVTSATTTTDYWDYLRGQSTTTTTVATDENGNPVTTTAETDENGNPISGTGSSESTEITTTTTMTAPNLFVTG